MLPLQPVAADTALLLDVATAEGCCYMLLLICLCCRQPLKEDLSVYGARATHTLGLRNLPCTSMPRCQARAFSRRCRPADVLSARLSCGAGGAITGRTRYMPYIVRHFFGATSMGATSGCLLTAIHRIVQKNCGSSRATDSDNCGTAAGKVR